MKEFKWYFRKVKLFINKFLQISYKDPINNIPTVNNKSHDPPLSFALVGWMQQDATEGALRYFILHRKYLSTVIFALGFCHLCEHAEDDDVILPVVGPQQELQGFQLVLLSSTAPFPPYKYVTMESASERGNPRRRQRENPRGELMENVRTLLVRYSKSCQTLLLFRPNK